MKFSIIIFAITLAFSISNANSIENRELLEKGLVTDVLQSLGKLLNCALKVVSTLGGQQLTNILTQLLTAISQFGTCTQAFQPSKPVVENVISILTCLLNQIVSLPAGLVSILISTLFTVLVTIPAGVVCILFNLI
ncbi:hypothetical protein FQR65_LT11947 [Abscondita terminalis]|nr:hypothetical protein FQR65_LT11947 [Abscondita terminalis]